MFIQATEVNGETKPVTIGVRYVMLVEPYDQASEPNIHAIIYLPGRVLNVAETKEQIDSRIVAAIGLPPSNTNTPF